MTSTQQRNFYHVGYGKAGSSTLQSVFFPKHSEVYFYGIEYTEDVMPIWPFRSAQTLCGQIVHPEYFESFDPADLQDLEGHKRKAAEEGKAFVYSNDHFSLLVAPEWSIGKMHELMPDAGIIMVLRRQQDILKSIYKYRGKELIYVPKKYESNFVTFDEYFEYACKNYGNRGGHKARDWVADYLRIIDFNRLASYYATAFGDDSIHILFFEDLVSKPEDFYRRLASILGISFDPRAPYITGNRPINASQTPAQLRYMQLKSALLGNFLITRKFPALRSVSEALHRRLRSVKAPDIAMNDDQMEVLRHLYSAGNRSLAERFGVDLESKGYLV